MQSFVLPAVDFTYDMAQDDELEYQNIISSLENLA